MSTSPSTLERPRGAAPGEIPSPAVGPPDDHVPSPHPPQPGHRPFALGQRRQFLIDRRLQLRAASLAAGVVLALVLLLNLALHVDRGRSAEALVSDAPELAELVRSQNRVELSLVLLASAVFVAGVFVVTVLETHRTSGAAYNLVRRLRDVRDGRPVDLRLRRGDNLLEVERAFNEMTAALRERAARELEALDEIAASMERVASPPEAAALAARIRDLAERKRSFADADSL
jgi:hypothetical protein